MTKAQAQKRLDYWQRKLGLGAWDIKLVFDEDPGFALCGECSQTFNRQKATVRIAWPCPAHEDLENTLVHELLHCYFTNDGRGEDNYLAVRLEQGVDFLAGLLLRMDK